MFERLGSIGFLLVLCLLSFVAGVFLALTETPPYHFFRDAHRAGIALIEQRKTRGDVSRSDLWRIERSTERGTTILKEGGVHYGYTLYTSGEGAQARLIAMDGGLLHEWSLPYSHIWDKEASSVQRPQPDELIFMRKAWLYPNGDLLAIYEAAGDTPYGYGMVKMDRHSRPIWSYLENTHHDFDIAPDGSIIALTHSFVWEGPAALDHLDRPYLDDFVVVLSPAGEELVRVSLVEALEASAFKAFIYAIPHFGRSDPLHTNSVRYVTEEQAALLPFAQEGQILVSFRDLGVVALLGIDLQGIVWAMRGPWMGQHHPSIVEQGDILLFDNLGGFRQGNSSRVLQFNPETLEIVWQYVGSDERPFDSALRAEAVRLANGNTLITESDGGRLFEVTKEGEIVWEYYDPSRLEQQGQVYIPIVAWGQRIDPDSLDGDFRALFEGERQLEAASLE